MTLKRIYYYLVCFVTLMMVVFGAVSFLQNVIDLVYPIDNAEGAVDYRVKAVLEKHEVEVPDEVWQELEDMNKLSRVDTERRYETRRMLNNLAIFLVAIPVYLYHWKRIKAE